MTPFEEGLLKRLDLIHNDLETLALGTLMLVPPLIFVTAPEGEKRDGLMQMVVDLQEVHLRASKEINAR